MSNGRMVYNSKFKAHENGSYLHYPETRHSTIALTEEAVTVMEDHLKETDNHCSCILVTIHGWSGPVKSSCYWEKGKIRNNFMSETEVQLSQN